MPTYSEFIIYTESLIPEKFQITYQLIPVHIVDIADYEKMEDILYLNKSWQFLQCRVGLGKYIMAIPLHYGMGIWALSSFYRIEDTSYL